LRPAVRPLLSRLPSIHPWQVSLVGAVIISRPLLYADPILSVSPLDLNNHWELPNLILLGLMIGVLAVSFIVAYVRLVQPPEPHPGRPSKRMGSAWE